MRVLVTGGAGYLGSVLCLRLIEEQHFVRCFDVLTSDTNSGDRGPYSSHFECVTGTILELVEHSSLLEGIEAVVHLAGLTSDETGNLDPHTTDLINRRATVELAERCLSEGISRLVFASSCAVYGAGAQLDETSPPHPQSPYARSKLLAEQELLRLTAHGLEPVLLRQASLFGWSPRMRYDLAVNAMTLDATTKGRVHVRGNGTQWRPFLHVSDAAEAFVRAAQAPAEKWQARSSTSAATNKTLPYTRCQDGN